MALTTQYYNSKLAKQFTKYCKTNHMKANEALSALMHGCLKGDIKLVTAGLKIKTRK